MKQRIDFDFSALIVYVIGVQPRVTEVHRTGISVDLTGFWRIIRCKFETSIREPVLFCTTSNRETEQMRISFGSNMQQGSHAAGTTIFIICLLTSFSAHAFGQRFEYSVKFICGKSSGAIVAPGTYFTAVNVHNPGSEAVPLIKKFVVALPAEKPGPVSKPFDAKLGPDEAFEIDCPDILHHLESRAEFVKGFVVIRSPIELNVVTVYTAAGATRFVDTLEVERTPARSASSQ